ncbi:uncharacterized protein B0H18DRAFT_34540 [Fomitopsis serialis]|uniref:uncharacterized protein n=1 Tax=Fomitopsis serialis TaxID=139415 RepID=UPI002008737F|nr:uncharacterized protein B0H18DRAFT_34540 [Neoantrodia serialis]KAH9917559.1 hypothetical protein B0H18DRAFT_34540 [Neoantrodia serialis]
MQNNAQNMGDNRRNGNLSQGGQGGQGSGGPPASSPTSPPNADGQATASQNPELLAVNELLSTMKLTLTTLGSTFDSLGKQTVSVASLCPRIEAAREIHETGEQLKERQKKQDDRMKELQEALAANVKEQREKWLNARVNGIVAEIVSKEVPRRVDYQLNVQIPNELKNEVNEYKRRILQVKIQLHNSDAKRRNSLLHSPSPAGDGQLSHLLPPLAAGVLELPKCPAFFPPRLNGLFKLSAQEVISLLQAYGIEECTDAAAASPLSPGGAAREENLNRLMQFIGVGLLVVPPLSPSPEGGESFLKSPVVTRRPGWPF